jgi:hypothetical protein
MAATVRSGDTPLEGSLEPTAALELVTGPASTYASLIGSYFL